MKSKPRPPGLGRRHLGTSGEHALLPSQVDPFLDQVADVRDAALLRVAAATGIRREDLVKVRLEAVDLATGTMRFMEGKKGKPHTVRFGGKTGVALEAHLKTLPRGTPWLFPSPNGRRPLSGRTAYNRFQYWLKRANLQPRPFHALRATFIKWAQAQGWTIEQVMKQTNDTYEVIKAHYSTPSRDEMDQLIRDRPL